MREEEDQEPEPNGVMVRPNNIGEEEPKDNVEKGRGYDGWSTWGGIWGGRGADYWLLWVIMG